MIPKRPNTWSDDEISTRSLFTGRIVPFLSRPEKREADSSATREPWWVGVFEVSIALVALIVMAPLMLAIAVIIRVGTPGPALFLQRRVGLNGKLFTFVKFRSMYADSRERFPELFDKSYTERELKTAQFKAEDDPRVTPQGNWLRRTSLDELPNFFNVVCRHMSLVGPRPAVPKELPYYTTKAMLDKFSVRPGITGFAQTCGRGRLTFYDGVTLDLEYVAKKSFLLDLRIISKTVWMVLRRDGAF